MRFTHGKIPAFSAGPLLMPPIQLMGLRMPSSNPAVEDKNLRTSARLNDPGRSANVRRFGTRFLFAARVRPLTLSALIRDENTGIPPMSQLEADAWRRAARFRPREIFRSIRREESL
jgi:hypothetical protein